MNTLVRGTLSIGILVAVTGCAATPPPTLQTGPNAEVSADGLVRVDHSVVPLAYLKPDMDLTPYTRFMLDPVEVAYQKDPGNRTRSGFAGTVRNFALSQRQMEDLREMFQEAVVEALTEEGGYELTTEPAPDVLRITAALIDLVVAIPTERTGSEDVYTRSYGMVTLVMELRDSQSGEILARAADRRDPTRGTDVRLARVYPGAARVDTRFLFEHWGDLLRERLDALREG